AMRRSFLAAAAAALLPLAAAAQEGVVRPRSTAEDLQMFSQVLNQIRVNHPDSVDTHDLFVAAVQAMVAAADPHSYVLPATRLTPETARAWREGKLHPVPVRFTYVGGSPVVVGVAPGSTAAGGDVLPGDELLAVDGRPVTAESETELEIALSGQRGTPVRLTLERRRADGSLARLERTVKRERVAEESAVPAAFLLDAETGYVRITTFSGDRVADDLHRALGGLEKAGMRRLVMDLRDNGGGSVDEAARVAGEFLPAGTVVYTSEGRKAEARISGRVERSFWRRERRYPIVLLVNGGTASASELIAGALQDHDRALVVGRATFGKSLMMQGFPLADGSAVMLVVGHLKTPCGRVVQRQYRGVTRRDYYRLGGEARDTVGRPSCRTASGRTVYGGGGIYPDAALPEAAPAPLWLARVREVDLPLQWIGGYLGAHAADFSTPEALAGRPALPAAALADFRAFAARQGVAVPAGAEADAQLQRALVLGVAAAKWGAAGYYRVAAALDPEVAAAVKELPRAAGILGAP
ncbi:MAG TPA: S41 family peptidase, partial [Longimicrobiaceae bacterium]|nr:S41 family peptidase [Longimicrobiaceae bacterium]